MRVYQLIRVSGGRPTATSGRRTAHRKRWDDLERIMRMVSSAIPIITFRYYPYKRKKLTFWVSLSVEITLRESIIQPKCEKCRIVFKYSILTVFQFQFLFQRPSQGHGRPCLQRSHPRRGFSATWFLMMVISMQCNSPCVLKRFLCTSW